MLDHIGIAVSNFDRACAFYDHALAPLGITLMMIVPKEHTGGVSVGGYGQHRPQFWIHEETQQHPGVHVAFEAADHATVDAFYHAALAAGGTDNGAPGLRPHYHESYYGAFVHDPDGNNIEAVCHHPQSQ